jgi:uncharacterized lipoprotein
MKHTLILFLSAIALAACAKEAPVDTRDLRGPDAKLMTAPCEPPPYPQDEGNPQKRAKWLAEDGKCDANKAAQIEGLQNYARAVTTKRQPKKGS